MSGRTVSAPPQLWHCYGAGLRFDTELQSLNAPGRWGRMSGLDASRLDSPVRAQQALALLGLRPSAAKPQPVACTHVDSVLKAVAKAILNGGAAVLCLQLQCDAPASRARAHRTSARWVRVIGVECQASTRHRRKAVRALLLWDPALPEVWACGYNARLNRVDASACVYRSLDGGCWSAQCLQALTLPGA